MYLTIINPCCDEYRSAECYINKTMSEYNFVVINCVVRAKPAGLSFLSVNLGVPWTLRLNSPVLLRSRPKCVVVFFRRGLPQPAPARVLNANSDSSPLQLSELLWLRHTRGSTLKKYCRWNFSLKIQNYFQKRSTETIFVQMYMKLAKIANLPSEKYHSQPTWNTAKVSEFGRPSGKPALMWSRDERTVIFYDPDAVLHFWNSKKK